MFLSSLGEAEHAQIKLQVDYEARPASCLPSLIVREMPQKSYE
jgi:hypothetical protein